MGLPESKNVKLSQEDIEFLTENTSYDGITIQEWYKGYLVDCPDGKLTKERFLRMYEMFFNKGDPEEFCHHVFRTFDADGNGYIDFKEFLLAVGVTTNGSTCEKLAWAFRMYDINGDGFIQTPEMTKIVQALYSMLGSALNEEMSDTPEERTKTIFEKMDTNLDGKLSLEEFLEGCTADPQLAQLLANHMPSSPS